MIPVMTQAQATRGRKGAAILRYPDLQPATIADVGQRKIVLLVHGLTADASYLYELMRQFDGAGYTPLAFEYPCYDGIDAAAKDLAALLSGLDQHKALSGPRIVVVGHSMGGLVARALIALEGGARYVRTVITLGSPHSGTLGSARIPLYMAYWGEAVCGLNPRGFSFKSASVIQLLRKDRPTPLLDTLMQVAPASQRVDYYSFSGGYNRIDFGKGYLKNALFNAYLQKHLPLPNDGLVPEVSSDLSQKQFSKCAPGCRHFRPQPNFGTLNHTYLIQNHLLALTTIQCAK